MAKSAPSQSCMFDAIPRKPAFPRASSFGINAHGPDSRVLVRRNGTAHSIFSQLEYALLPILDSVLFGVKVAFGKEMLGLKRAPEA